MLEHGGTQVPTVLAPISIVHMPLIDTACQAARRAPVQRGAGRQVRHGELRQACGRQHDRPAPARRIQRDHCR